jgi:hypothetical protein
VNSVDPQIYIEPHKPCTKVKLLLAELPSSLLLPAAITAAASAAAAA